MNQNETNKQKFSGMHVTFQLTALLVKCDIISLENAPYGDEHKCMRALDAHFIGYQHDAVVKAFLYISDSETVGRASLEGSMQC